MQRGVYLISCSSGCALNLSLTLYRSLVRPGMLPGWRASAKMRLKGAQQSLHRSPVIFGDSGLRPFVARHPIRNTFSREEADGDEVDTTLDVHSIGEEGTLEVLTLCVWADKIPGRHSSHWFTSSTSSTLDSRAHQAITRGIRAGDGLVHLVTGRYQRRPEDVPEALTPHKRKYKR